jgi:hypothetical protein
MTVATAETPKAGVIEKHFGADELAPNLIDYTSTYATFSWPRALYQRKVAPIRSALADLRHVLLAGVDPGATLPADTQDLAALMAHADEHFIIPRTSDEDPAPISRAGPRARRKAHCTSTPRSSRITSRASSRSTSTTTTFSGAPPTQGGLRGRRMASSRRSPMAGRASSTRPTSTSSAGTASCRTKR